MYCKMMKTVARLGKTHKMWILVFMYKMVKELKIWIPYKIGNLLYSNLDWVKTRF